MGVGVGGLVDKDWVICGCGVVNIEWVVIVRTGVLWGRCGWSGSGDLNG